MKNCYLIIDEADSILIDEITNGTILSKPMKSNGIDVLTMVYKLYMSGQKDSSYVLGSIKNAFPECVDLTVDHIEKMFSDIKLVNSDEYTNKKKYIIANDEVMSLERKIIPFDSNHKGIIEPNKEFNGFIHQFIGIKHKEKNPTKYKDLKITPLSMNYLFISHPIFVQKYKGACGVTGTIGGDKEREMFKKYYNLVTHKVPRHLMDLKRILPRIVCNDIQTRNKRICEEICNFHKLKYPILIVFANLKEIDQIQSMLVNEYCISENKIMRFTGDTKNNDESDKKKLEENAGKPGRITLGTNYCGRGVDIKYTDKPLVVLVTYDNDDKRAIQQVLGHSGRNGSPGIARIICTKQMVNEYSKKIADTTMIAILNEFDIKKSKVHDLINTIREKHYWIFNESDYNTRLLVNNS